MREISRDEWVALTDEFNSGLPQGAENAEVRLSDGRAHIEFYGESSSSQIDVYFTDDASDLRIGDLQILVTRGSKGPRFALLRQHPPYPINRWTVIAEGDLPK